jgi:outer membrane protein assembly factor BamB
MKIARRSIPAIVVAATFASLIATMTVASLIKAPPARGAGEANWPAYMFSEAHSSFNAAATAITPSNAASLNLYWRWKADAPTMTGQPPAGFYATPAVRDGRVYIGANTGVFYALDLATKTVVWKRFLGFIPHYTCGKRGITSSATVAPDASRGGQLTVYVAGGDGYLYALRASDGAVVWKSVVGLHSPNTNDYYNWSSPAVLNGRVYIGLTSQCDNPLVRGGAIGYQQSTGAQIGTYYAMAPTRRGGGVWSSPAVNAQNQVFVTTGTGRLDDAESIVRIDGPTMTRQEAWKVPDNEAIADSDFGASPTLFNAVIQGVSTPMVGACNKNGLFYAMKQTQVAAGPVWRYLAADPSRFGETSCLAAAVWDGSRLFVAGSPTTIGGVDYQGAVRRLDPATGTPIWQRGLAGVILGTPTLDGAGVIAAGTYDSDGTNSVYLLNASNGNVLREIPMGSTRVFSQPVFADNYLLVGRTGGAGLMIYTP